MCVCACGSRGGGTVVAGAVAGRSRALTPGVGQGRRGQEHAPGRKDFAGAAGV